MAARQQGLYRPMLIGLLLCHSLLGPAVPEEITNACSGHPIARRLVSSLEAYYSRSSGYQPDDFFRLGFGLLTADRHRTHGIMALMASMLRPTENDYGWIGLPAILGWLYPPLRLVRRIGKALAVIRRRVYRRDGAV